MSVISTLWKINCFILPQNEWGYDMRRGMNVSWESLGQYTTDLLGDEAVRKIDAHDTRNPLFLYVAHLAVHSANQYQFLEAPQIIVDKFNYIEDKNRRIFAGNYHTIINTNGFSFLYSRMVKYLYTYSMICTRSDALEIGRIRW